MCNRYFPIVFFIFLLSNFSAKATHIYGGELLYTHISGNSYQIALTLYGDCSGQSFPNLGLARPTINIFKGTSFVDSIFLNEDVSLRKEVSPVCTEDKDSTACKNTNSLLPGVTQFVYVDTVDLLPASNWLISFSGIMNKKNTLAGRSNSITNISIAASGSIMYLEATLNNLTAPNSSPQYTSIPTPFFCINKSQQYNQGAVDKDADSLSFSLIDALIRNNTPVTYIAQYNGAFPLGILGGTFSFNGNSGQLAFVPNVLQRSVVVNKVEEYKNGVLVGSSMREMTFIVIDYCNNTPPKGDIDSKTLVGGGVADNIINVCVNTPNLAFNIPGVDDDNDTISVNINNLPQGAVATISKNNSQNPVINFSWNTQNTKVGDYNMYITYTDDACPLISSQTIAYTIRVVNPIGITHEVIQPTNCIFKEHILIKITDGVLPREVTIRNNSNNIIGQYIDSTGVIIDSFKAGKYTIHAASEALQCQSDYSFTVEDSGTYPIPPAFKNLDACLNDEVQPLEVTLIQDAIVKWYTAEGAMLSETPTYSTDKVASYAWFVTQQVGICESAIKPILVNVHGFPNIKVANIPEQVCIGDAIKLSATGGVKYDWSPESVISNVKDSAFVFVMQPTTFTVKGYDIYGCMNTDSVTYSDIKQCCTFSYPNAFTPNNDGINDGWKPVTYGNMDYYLLSVFNRWGQKVFSTTDPNERWNGTFGGKLADLDTYHYSVSAKCATGYYETSKGSFILIR